MNILENNVQNYILKFSIYALYALIITIPFTHKEMFSVIDQDLVISKFILVILAFLGVILFLYNFKAIISDVVFIFLFSLLIFQLLSLINTHSYVQSLRFISFTVAILFSYIPIKFTLYKKENLIKIIKVIDITYLLVLLFWIVQFFIFKNYKTLIGGIWPVTDTDIRYGATFWDINHFAIYLATTFFILLTYFIHLIKVKSKKNLLFFITIINLFTVPILLYYTKSRSGIVSFLIGLTVFIMLMIAIRYKDRISKYKPKLWHFIFISVSLVLLWHLVINLFSHALHKLFLFRAMSLFAHLYLIKVGIRIGTKNFLSGIGVNAVDLYFKNSGYAESYYFIDPAAQSYKLPLHSLWLEVYTETGMLSFILFSLFFAALLYLLYRLVVNKTDIFSVGLISVVVTFLIGGLMYSYKSEFFWIMVLISGGYALSDYKNSSFKESSTKILGGTKFKISYVLYGILMVVAVIIPFMFMFNPLSIKELELINGYIPDRILLIQRLFEFLNKQVLIYRYIFGNYSYTPRLFSLPFLFGATVLMIGLFKRNQKTFVALLSVIMTVYVGAVLSGTLLHVSILWLLVFIMLLIVSFLQLVGDYIISKTQDGSKPVCSTTGILGKLNRILSTPKYLAIIILLLIPLFIFRENKVYSKYDYDKSFILELAHNKGIAHNSDIIINKPFISNKLAHYYFDRVDRVHGVILLKPSNFKYLSISELNPIKINFMVKNLIIGDSKFGKAYEKIYKQQIPDGLPVHKYFVRYNKVVLIFHDVDKAYK